MNPANSIGNAVKGATALLALLPFLVMVMGAVKMPPSEADLTKGLSLAVGLGVVFAILIGRDRIKRASVRAIVLLALGLTVAGLVSAFAYYEFGQSHIIDYSIDDTDRRIIAPISPDSELRRYRDGFGGYPQAAENPIFGGRVLQLIDEQNNLTVPALILLLLAAQTCLSVAVISLAWRYASSLGDEPEPSPEPV